MHFHHPSLIILLIKYDLASVYRRLQRVGKNDCVSDYDPKNIGMRFQFGVASGPSDYCIISELIIDLTNEILRVGSWNTPKTYSLISTHLDKLKKTHKESIPFIPGRPVFVRVPYSAAVVNGYIDYLIMVVAVKENWLEQAQNASLLAIHTAFCSTNPSDPLTRADAISGRKLKRDDTPDETKTTLG